MASGPGPSSVPIHSCLPSPKQNPFSPDLSPRLTRGSHRAFSAQQSPGYWKEKKEGERQPIAPEARTLPPRRAQKVGGRAVLAGAGWRRYLPINHWGPGLLQGQEAKAIHLEVELRGLQEGVWAGPQALWRARPRPSMPTPSRPSDSPRCLQTPGHRLGSPGVAAVGPRFQGTRTPSLPYRERD